jgi:DNA modification methylase
MIRVITGDCVEAMRAMPAASVDAVVCDPPYGLEFMGKEWDAPWAPGRGVGEHNAGFSPGAPAEHGVRGAIKALPSYTGATNPTCRNCGGTRNGRDRESRRRCRCDQPQFPNTTLPRMVAFQAWCEAWASEALRVLKPGGHLLAFGGTRTYHRLTCAIEDAGFEVRDCLAWLYGSGFPKSLDVSRAMEADARPLSRAWVTGPYGTALLDVRLDGLHDEITVRADAQARHAGEGTALKPAHEPIVLARKPLAGTVAGNVLAHGTGALNVDGCRIGTDDNLNGGAYSEGAQKRRDGWVSARAGDENAMRNGAAGQYEQPPGRWPANVVLDPEAAALLDEQTGERRSAGEYAKGAGVQGDKAGAASIPINGLTSATYADSGGASRFFYVAKASSAERNAGLDGFEAIHRVNGNKWTDQDYRVARGERAAGRVSGPRRNVHPTVKPIDLMRWLCRLVTPPGGTVLDPFAGSGTTGIACQLEGLNFIGIEREADYADIARARIAWWSRRDGGKTKTVLRALKAQDSIGQLELEPQ